MVEQDSCIFCAIISKKIPASIVLETKSVVAFRDINPVAPTHILIVPKIHVASMNQVTSDQLSIVAEMLVSAQKIAQDVGIERTGYRLVINTERGAGQTVDHIHLHLIGGRPLSWPPG